MTPLARCTPAMLANDLPVRLVVHPDITVAELIAETTRRMRQVFRHQRYDITNLRRDLGRIDSDRRVFGPTVNFMPFDYDLRFGGHPAIAHNLTNGPVEDLSIVVYDRLDSRGIRTHFNANPALYCPDEVADLHQRFLGLLAAIADPDQPIGRLDILSAAERRTLLTDWNATARALPLGHPAAAVCGAGGTQPRRRRRWCATPVRSATASSNRAPISWRITCARSGSVPRWWWGCAWSARRR